MNREDTARRIYSTSNQLEYEGAHTFCMRRYVVGLATSICNNRKSKRQIIADVEEMRRTFEPDSKGWAVLGCVLNILNDFEEEE